MQDINTKPIFIYTPAALLNFAERVDCNSSPDEPVARRLELRERGVGGEVPLFSHDAHRSFEKQQNGRLCEEVGSDF